MKAVLLAGGKGRRLQPFTTTIPKPLFPIGEKPIILIIIEQLKSYGIKEFIISLGYLGELIEAYLGNGAKFGCSISYVRENEPLGTAGAISLLPPLSDDYVFMNGDILSTIDFMEAVSNHKKSNSLMTICTYEKTVQSSLGVLSINEKGNVTDYSEKPTNKYLVSSGIYIMKPEISNYIDANQKFDIPGLVNKLISCNQQVGSYAISGKWFDIGTPEDLELAEKFVLNNNLS